MTQNVTHIRFSILGGTVSSVWFQITSEDLIKTAVMAAFGAIVSYLVSLIAKRIHQYFLQRKKK